jgi:5'-phosphate synthase pdxT subunit
VQRVGVLALQGDIGEHAEVLRSLGAEPVPVRRPADLDRVHSLVLPGGESTAISLLLGSAGLEEPLRRRLHAGMPAFGTCAGMILLSRHIRCGRPDQVRFGAIDTVVRRNAFGRQVNSFETDLNVEGLDRPFHAVFIRAPAVEETGPGVEVLARVPVGEGPGPAVVCRQGPILVSAFHPELSGDARLHQMFLEEAGRSRPALAESR